MTEERNNGKNGKGIDSISYVLGQLRPEEEAQFETFLTSGDPESIRLAQEVAATLDGMTVLAEEVAASMPAPRRGLKDRVMKAAIQSTTSADKASTKKNIADFVIRSSEGMWQETGFPGVTLKMLHNNAGDPRSTVLVRIAAGARYPQHRHVGYEECLVVEGDLHINGVDLNAGDYILTPHDTEHHDTYSVSGCMLLLSTQLEDEVLER
jgi:anti-sigma factor ChrR (cupin superfamily)